MEGIFENSLVKLAVSNGNGNGEPLSGISDGQLCPSVVFWVYTQLAIVCVYTPERSLSVTNDIL